MPLKTDTATPPRTFRDVLRNNRFKFTEREILGHLRMAYRGLRQREEDPSRLTIAELLRVADLVNEPIEDIIAVVLAEVRVQEAAAPLADRSGGN